MKRLFVLVLLIASLVAFPVYAADLNYSGLNALGGAPAATDLIPMWDIGVAETKTMTVGNLFTTPALISPDIGTPTAGVLTFCTGLPLTGIDGMAAGVSTFMTTPSSANLATALTDETGTGLAVFSTSPVLVTPTLGVATATSLDTGYGANELYDMNQNVQTTDAVTFGDVTVGAAGTDPGLFVLHDAGTITMYDDGNDTSIVIGPVADGTTTLGITGSLDVSGTLEVGTTETITGTDPATIYDVSTATDIDYWAGATSDNDGVADTSDLYQIGKGTVPGTTPLVTVQGSTGNVGINTTVPQSLLDVQGPTGTGTATAGKLTLATKELTVVAGDELGRINFNAPLESDGTDAILPGASIWAVSEGTFGTTNNATSLVLATGASEAAAEKMRITSGGLVQVGTAAGAGQVNITPASAITGLAITPYSGSQGISVLNSGAGISVYAIGKYAFAGTQTVTNGYVASFNRNLNEAGANPLIKLEDSHANNTQPTLFIDHNGTGGATGYGLHVDGENAAAPAVLIEGAAGGDLRLGGSIITAGSGSGITVNQAGNVNSQLYKVTTTYAAYTDSDTTKGIVICTLPAKTKIVGFYSDTTTPYTGGTTDAATMVVGITAESAAEIIASHDVFAGAILAGDADAEMGTSMTRAAAIQGGYMPSWSGTTAIYATLVIATDILSNLTAGSTTFYIETERY